MAEQTEREYEARGRSSGRTPRVGTLRTGRPNVPRACRRVTYEAGLLHEGE
ncbi:MAG: hypothetical protein ACOY9Y_07210 [Bacillota bacterium]